jgi:hypothetical protein
MGGGGVVGIERNGAGADDQADAHELLTAEGSDELETIVGVEGHDVPLVEPPQPEGVEGWLLLQKAQQTRTVVLI